MPLVVNNCDLRLTQGCFSSSAPTAAPAYFQDLRNTNPATLAGSCCATSYSVQLAAAREAETREGQAKQRE